MPSLILDEFRGDLATDLADHTPNAGAWTIIQAAATPQLDGDPAGNATEWLYNGGLWCPDTSLASIPHVGLDVGAVDHIAAGVVLLFQAPAAGDIAGLYLAGSASNRKIALIYDPAAAQVKLTQQTGGATATLAFWPLVLAPGDLLQLAADVIISTGDVIPTVNGDVKAPVVASTSGAIFGLTLVNGTALAIGSTWHARQAWLNNLD